MAYIVLVFVAIGITYFLWKHQAKVKELLNELKPQPLPDLPHSSPPAEVATGKNPIDTSFHGAVIGTATESLIGGKPTGNAPEGYKPGNYDPASAYRYDFNLDQPSVTFVFPAGVSVYSVPVHGGDIVQLEIVPSKDGAGSGRVSSGAAVGGIVNGFGSLRFQAQQDNPSVVVDCDKPGYILRRP